MVRTNTEGQIKVPAWLSRPVVWDEPGRRLAIYMLQVAYRATPADAKEDYLEALAEATGSGRFDSERARCLWMTWDMVREMRTAGMCIGGHTIKHPILSQLRPVQQWQEIAGCGRRLEEELGEPMRIFSYPNGGRQDFDDETRTCLPGPASGTPSAITGAFESSTPGTTTISAGSPSRAT